ncbi:hypothetical protein VTK56DRAFT_7743 [Thermocarpiscus australiensis]
MSDQDWGPAPPAAGADDFRGDESADAFGTSELRETLPASGNNHNDDNPETPSAAAAAAGWVKPTPYDYDAYGAKAPHDWEGNAVVYEWDGKTGDVGPENPDLELQLFGEPGKRATSGIDFSKIASIEVVQEGPARVEPIANFEGAGLHPIMLKNVQMAGYELATPIQRYCIPAIHMGYDVIAIAQTGSGKTAAYLIPILNKLMGKAKKLAATRPNPVTFNPKTDPPVRAEPLVVIVCPSRELAVQIFNEARKFCYRTMLRPCVVYGGGSFKDQIEQLQKGCDVLVASPGRLVDFIQRPSLLSLRRVRYMVIDEADEMLEEDWKEDFRMILSGGDQEEGNIKYMLFSATFPKGARELAKTYLAENHVRIRVGRAGSSHENIKQNVIYVDPSLKKQALADLMSSLPPTRTIIFVNHKRTADELDDYLYNHGFPCSSMHSDRTQKEREATMRGFRSGDSPILITTGVTARGIDVRNVMHVVNYDLPSMDHGGIEEYIHRIGRTGRIGHRGLATSFYSNRDEAIASVLTRTLMETKQEIPDFLQQYVPEGATAENLKFEADSDFEDNTAGTGAGAGNGGGDAWGGGDDGWGDGNGAADAAEVANGGGDAWGTEASEPAQLEEANAGW